MGLWVTDGSVCGTKKVVGEEGWETLNHRYLNDYRDSEITFSSADENFIYLHAKRSDCESEACGEIVSISRDSRDISYAPTVAGAPKQGNGPGRAIYANAENLYLYSPDSGIIQRNKASGGETLLTPGYLEAEYPNVYDGAAYFTAVDPERGQRPLVLIFSTNELIDFEPPFTPENRSLSSLGEGFFAVRYKYDSYQPDIWEPDFELRVLIHERYLIPGWNTYAIYSGGAGQLWVHSGYKGESWLTVIEHGNPEHLYQAYWPYSHLLNLEPYSLGDHRYVVNGYGEPNLIDIADGTMKKIFDVPLGPEGSEASAYAQIGNLLFFRARHHIPEDVYGFYPHGLYYVDLDQLFQLSN